MVCAFELVGSNDGSTLILGIRYLVSKNEFLQERLEYLDDGKTVFKLRSRLCSSLYPVNERIRDFFSEYDRHVLRTSPPWGTELMEVFFYAELQIYLHLLNCFSLFLVFLSLGSTVRSPLLK